MKRVYLLTICFIAFYEFACCQSIALPFTTDKWNLQGAETSLETYQGKECILFKSGNIFTKDVDLRDGTIEFDMSVPQQRGFPGIAFRITDPSNFENFYVRPHQSGNPDATQYTPVFNGNAGWQLYHGEGYSKAIRYNFDQWHHIKIDIHGITAEIYIDDMQTPFIKVTELKRGHTGGNIGLISGNLPVRFANVQYTVKSAATFTPIPVPVNGTGGLITRYQISNQLTRAFFENKLQITPDMKAKLKWTTASTESSGTINLSRYAVLSDTTNVVIARVIINSDKEQVKALQFGFSDYVSVYLNDKALYSGADNFLSRDYRYLGTIGFFDALYLPLQKGDNELWFAVSDDFGGWGIKARLGDMEGISLK